MSLSRIESVPLVCVGGSTVVLVMSNSDDVIISLNDVIAADQTQQMARQMSMQGSPALSAKQDPNQLFKVHIYLSHSSHSMTMAPCTHVCT